LEKSSVDGLLVTAAQDEQGPPRDAAAAGPRDPAVDGNRYPILGLALVGRNGPELRRELIALLSERELRERAPRRSVYVMCRLEGPGYDEPVLVKDISASGVRFLLQSDVSLDVNQVGNLTLHVRTSGGPQALPLALVRRCGGDQRHTEVACRFLNPTPDYPQFVADLVSNVFGTRP
jgi:hypothetical protein